MSVFSLKSFLIRDCCSKFTHCVLDAFLSWYKHPEGYFKDFKDSEKAIRTFAVSNSLSPILLSMPSSSLWKSHFKHCQMSTLPTLSTLSSGLLILKCIGPLVTYSILWELMFTSVIKPSAEAIKNEVWLGGSVADYLPRGYDRQFIKCWSRFHSLVLISLWLFNYKERN